MGAVVRSEAEIKSVMDEAREYAEDSLTDKWYAGYAKALEWVLS